MMKEYDVRFLDSTGNTRVIGKATVIEDVWKVIDNFIEDCNKKKPEDKKFIRYYSRLIHREDGSTWIDVGSHTESFETDFPIKVGE